MVYQGSHKRSPGHLPWFSAARFLCGSSCGVAISKPPTIQYYNQKYQTILTDCPNFRPNLRYFFCDLEHLCYNIGMNIHYLPKYASIKILSLSGKCSSLFERGIECIWIFRFNSVFTKYQYNDSQDRTKPLFYLSTSYLPPHHPSWSVSIPVFPLTCLRWRVRQLSSNLS